MSLFTMVTIDKILKEIKDNDLVKKLRLTSGNCGVFAAALKRQLGRGEILNINHGAHLCLLVDGMCIDGEGICTKEQWLGRWICWGPLYITNDEEEVLLDTGEFHTVDEMEEIILELAEGKSVERWHR